MRTQQISVPKMTPALMAALMSAGREDVLRHAEVRELKRNPGVDGVEEAIEWTVFDSFSIAANTAVAKQIMFQVPQSGAKTPAQTNMKSAGRFANGDRFVVYQIRCFIANDTVPTDVNNILRNTTLTFRVRTKPYAELIPVLAPAGCGLNLSAVSQVGTAPAGTAVAFATSNGGLDPRAGYIFKKGVPIKGDEAFDVTFNPETAFNTAAAGANPAGVGTTIYVFLDGVLYRGVQ